MTVNSNVYLKHARYGKDLVRLLRVYKEGDVQHCTELTVSCMIRQDAFMLISNQVRLLLEGDIETSYTKADNSVIVATGKIKKQKEKERQTEI